MMLEGAHPSPNRVDIDWWKAWVADVDSPPPVDAWTRLATDFERSVYAAGPGTFDGRFAAFLESIGLADISEAVGELLASFVFDHHRKVTSRPILTTRPAPLRPPE